jgi:ubiquinone biosynthesis protein
MRVLFRVLYIHIVFLKYGLDELFFSRRLNPIRYYYDHDSVDQQVSGRLLKALYQLGPVFIKFGQILSTRYDVLSKEMIEALRDLHDAVPPFSSEQAIGIVEHQLKKPINALFKRFDIAPLAAASIAQVHSAQLHTGEEVVVKIVRPGLSRKIKKDIKILKYGARFVSYFFKKTRTLHLLDLVIEFERVLFNELDLLQEAANASQLKRNVLLRTKTEKQPRPLIEIPAIYWEYSTHTVLVMERMFGVPVDDRLALEKAGVDLKLLARRGVDVFFKQVFKDCFFHGDLHPGNVFVNTIDPEDPTFIVVDFGIMGSLAPDEQYYLAFNFWAFLNRDYRRVALLHIDSGWVPRHTRVDIFEAAIRSVCEPLLEQPIDKISFAQLIGRLFEVAQQFKMEIQPQLLVFKKTLLHIEGLGRNLDPTLNIWTEARSLLESWVKEQLGVRGFLKQLKSRWPEFQRLLLNLPVYIEHCAQQKRQPKGQPKGESPNGF